MNSDSSSAPEDGKTSAQERHRALPSASAPHMELTEPRSWWRQTLLNYKGMVMVLAAEMFGAGMAATTRLLQLDREDGKPGMHTFQIMFLRFALTIVLSTLYMYFAKTPDFPLGPRKVRHLLVLRGLFGFFGCWGFYCQYLRALGNPPRRQLPGGHQADYRADSLRYLDLAEGIIIGFIAPLATGVISSLVMHQPVSKKQLIASVVAFLGIVIIAQPWSTFNPPDASLQGEPPAALPPVAGLHRYGAIGMGLMAVIAATSAYTCIRVIGDSTHALIQVNYYGLVTVVISGALLLLPIFPGLDFRLPDGLREWTLLFYIGCCGFMLQFLMTAGLQLDKSSKATNMMYSQILYALVLDWLIWGSMPGWWSAIGGSTVLGAVVWGAMQKDQEGGKKKVGDEEYAMVPPDEYEIGDAGSDDDDDDDDDKGKYDDEDDDDDDDAHKSEIKKSEDI
ncbi:MAG: hypothetical protein M1818_006000 [Claussenomyces sp. TS43310]|nr:MAG: hypothetical protein M1818_006000 [Claussenomyces sp. TS43310]